MIRLFVALNFPEVIKEQIIRLRNETIPNPFDYKWEPVQKLHLTLKFIGEVEENLVEKISNEINFISEYKVFSCSFDNFGFFYKEYEPRVLWLSFKIDDEIFDLVKKLNENLSKLGIEEERKKFKPHLTLMRIKKKLDKNFINSFENCKLPGTEFTANSISLFKSELHPKGFIYKELEKFNLKTMGGFK
jgi:2'-5' RNA ligase